MLNKYKIIFNKNGNDIVIRAQNYYIKDNLLYFEVYNDVFTNVACFNLNNIIGFYKVKEY